MAACSCWDTFSLILSAWEHERFVADVLASNGFMAVLRLGLADELDGLSGDLAGMLNRWSRSGPIPRNRMKHSPRSAGQS